MADILKFLIVENNLIEAEQIKQRLLRQGYLVTEVVSTGENALEAVSRELPSIVIMDIELDGEWDGVETARRIYQFWQLPIIYLTVRSDESDYHRAKYNIAAEYLQKPFSLVNLLNSIDHIVKEMGKTLPLVGKNLYVKRSKKGYYVLPFDDIIYFNADGSTTNIYTGNQAVRSLKPLAQFDQLLSSLANFERCHYSYIINLDHVVNLAEMKSGKKSKLEFKVSIDHDDTTIPIGITYKQRILSILMQG